MNTVDVLLITAIGIIIYILIYGIVVAIMEKYNYGWFSISIIAPLWPIVFISLPFMLIGMLSYHIVKRMFDK